MDKLNALQRTITVHCSSAVCNGLKMPIKMAHALKDDNLLNDNTPHKSYVQRLAIAEMHGCA